MNNENTLISTNPCAEISLPGCKGVTFICDNISGELVEVFQLALLNIRREIGLKVKYESEYFSECSPGIYETLG